MYGTLKFKEWRKKSDSYNRYQVLVSLSQRWTLALLILLCKAWGKEAFIYLIHTSYWFQKAWEIQNETPLFDKMNIMFKNMNKTISRRYSLSYMAEEMPQSVQFSLVAQSCLTLCDPHGRQHARPPCPSPTPGVHPNSCPCSRWCHPTISSSVVPFSACP